MYGKALLTILLAVITATTYAQERPTAKETASPQARLNILIIDICSARADHFGAYGYKRGATPGMDAVAKAGVVFENASAQASWCLSNYASLFTGHTPEVHGVYAMTNRTLPESQITVAQRLKEGGYDTAAYSGGTWLLPDWGLNRGFDHYVNTLSTQTWLTAFSKRMPEMLDWVKARGARPFFLYASVEDLHLPYDPDIRLTQEPDSDSVDLDKDGGKVALLRAADGSAPKRQDPPASEPGVKTSSAKARPELVAKYDASLARTDKQIAEFLRRIKEMGLWDKTLVIVTGDHGEGLGEHGLTGHMEGLYQTVLHVPLIVRHPGFPELAGRRFPQLVERIDLASTILDAAGQPYGDMELQGRSLLSLFREPSLPWREYAFSASKRSTHFATDLLLDERTVRTRRWKLHWYLHKNRFELYDLLGDPGEERDLSRKRPDIVSNLSFELLRHLETVRPHAPGLPSGNPPLEPGKVVPRRTPD